MKAGGDFVPYYAPSAWVAKAVSEEQYEKAILICGTGAGSEWATPTGRSSSVMHTEKSGIWKPRISNASISMFGMENNLWTLKEWGNIRHLSDMNAIDINV